MNELKELAEIRDRLQILSDYITSILRGIDNDSIKETRERYHQFLKITNGDDLWSFEDDIRDIVSAKVDRIMGWKND